MVFEHGAHNTFVRTLVRWLGRKAEGRIALDPTVRPKPAQPIQRQANPHCAFAILMKLEGANLVSPLARRDVNETRSPATVRLLEPVKAAIRGHPDRTLTILMQRIDALGVFIITQSVQLKHLPGSG